MEDKKLSDNQKLKYKKNYLRTVSPPENDNMDRKRESKEMPEESNNKYDNQTNDYASPNTQPSRERTWNEKTQRNKSKNKSKTKTSHKNKVMREYENNYQVVDSRDDSLDKKNKLYENKRDNFLDRYMTKARENGLEEVPNHENKNQEKKASPDFIHINNNEKIMDLIEIIKNKNKKYEDNNNIKNYNSNKPIANERKKKGKDKGKLKDKGKEKDKDRNSLKKENKETNVFALLKKRNSNPKPNKQRDNNNMAPIRNDKDIDNIDLQNEKDNYLINEKLPNIENDDKDIEDIDNEDIEDKDQEKKDEENLDKEEENPKDEEEKSRDEEDENQKDKEEKSKDENEDEDYQNEEEKHGDEEEEEKPKDEEEEYPQDEEEKPRDEEENYPQDEEEEEEKPKDEEEEYPHDEEDNQNEEGEYPHDEEDNQNEEDNSLKEDDDTKNEQYKESILDKEQLDENENSEKEKEPLIDIELQKKIDEPYVARKIKNMGKKRLKKVEVEDNNNEDNLNNVDNVNNENNENNVNDINKIDNNDNNVELPLNEPQKSEEKPKVKPKEKTRGKSKEKMHKMPKYNDNKPKTKNKNKSLENRKKKLNINVFSDSNNKNINNTDENYYSPQKTEDNINYKNKESNKDVMSKNLSNTKKKYTPKLPFNPKLNKPNYTTAHKASENPCSLCNKKTKKYLMCPKCHKNFCEQCIKSKKKNNKLCPTCKYQLKETTKVFEPKTNVPNTNPTHNYINKTYNPRIPKYPKNKNVKDTNDPLNRTTEHDYPQTKKNPNYGKKNVEAESAPVFSQNRSDKKNKKTKNVMRYSDKNKINNLNEPEEDKDKDNKNKKKTYDNRKSDTINPKKPKQFLDTFMEKNKPTDNKLNKKRIIKKKESIDADADEHELGDYEDHKPNESDKDADNVVRSSLKKPTPEKKQKKKVKIVPAKLDNEEENNLDNEGSNEKDNNLENEENDEHDSHPEKKEKNEDEENNEKENSLENEDNNEKELDDNDEVKEDENTQKLDFCPEHNTKKLIYYCFQCDKDYCEDCLYNHSNEHNLINYTKIDSDKFKELVDQKREIVDRNKVLQDYLNDFEQKLKSYKLEKDLFITEINKIANDYIGNIESKINDISSITDKIKGEQNKIAQDFSGINDKFNLFYQKYVENNNNFEDINTTPENPDEEKVDYSPDVQKWNEHTNTFKFNYFTSQLIHDMPINTNNDTIVSSELYFKKDNLNNFINDLQNDNKVNNNDDNETNNQELKNNLFNDDNTIDSFAIKNYDKQALIQVNINLDKNNNNDNFDYNNAICYLLISSTDMNNYCQLSKKMLSDGNLCFYEVIPWEQFNIFNYNNLCFKVLLFNHNE